MNLSMLCQFPVSYQELKGCGLYYQVANIVYITRCFNSVGTCLIVQLRAGSNPQRPQVSTQV